MKRRSLRIAWLAYAILAIGLTLTTVITGRRASAAAGTPHYLFTRMQVFVEQRIEATDATDAELDSLFEDAGEPPTMTVARPAFVLGFLDATLPVTLFGGLALVAATVATRRR